MTLSQIVFLSSLLIGIQASASSSEEFSTQALSSPALFWKNLRMSIAVSAETKRLAGLEQPVERSLLKIPRLTRKGQPQDRHIGGNIWLILKATMEAPGTRSDTTGKPYQLNEPHFFNQEEIFSVFDAILKGQHAYVRFQDASRSYESNGVQITYLEAAFAQWNESRRQRGKRMIELSQIIGLETKRYPYYVLSALRLEGEIGNIQLTPSTQLPGFNLDLVLKPPYVHLHIHANSRNLFGVEGPLMDNFFNNFLEIIRVAFKAHYLTPQKLADILAERAENDGAPFGAIWKKSVIIPLTFIAHEFMSETDFRSLGYPTITFDRVLLDPEASPYLTIALIEELSYLIDGPTKQAQTKGFIAMVRAFGLEELSKLFKEMDFGVDTGTGQLFARHIEFEMIPRFSGNPTHYHEQAEFLTQYSSLIETMYAEIDAYIRSNFPTVTLTQILHTAA